MTTQMNKTIKVGDKVTFDNDQIEIFKAEKPVQINLCRCSEIRARFLSELLLSNGV